MISPKEQVLKGLRGSTILDVGYVWQPYVPMLLKLSRAERRLKKAGIKMVPKPLPEFKESLTEPLGKWKVY